MKYIIYLSSVFFLLNCLSLNKSNSDFIFSSKFYNKKGKEISEIYYDSQTGLFKLNRPKEVVIILNNNDKEQIYSFYKDLNLASNSCFIKFEDSTSSKSVFIRKNTHFKEIKCNSMSKEEVDKQLMFYAKILNTLKSKKEYHEAFPDEFEVY